MGCYCSTLLLCSGWFVEAGGVAAASRSAGSASSSSSPSSRLATASPRQVGALPKRLASLLQKAGGPAQPVGRIAEWASVVETTRCSSLLRSRLRAGLVVDVGAASMLTAWFLREGRTVLLVSSAANDAVAPLGPADGLVHLPGETLGRVLHALRDLEISPGLLFLEPSLLLGDRQAGLPASSQGDWDGIAQVGTLFPGLPVAGALLTADGREVPHWALPSLFAPWLASENNMEVELPCWAAGGCPPRLKRPLLTLTMIVKDEARRIQETIESIAVAADRVVLLDTGSADGTQDIAQRVSTRLGLPLELFEEPFVDFAATRNRVLQLAGNATEFVLMLSGDEVLAHPEELRLFLKQRSGFCGGSDELFNLRVFMGPSVWYWSERLFRADNHAWPGWPGASNNTWRYVGVTHEAYVNPTRTLDGDLFIPYVGDTDPREAGGMPAPVPGRFFVSHDAERTPEKQRWRLRQDVRLLEAYLDRPDAHEDPWQYSRSLFYLAQSHRSLGFLAVARELWERYLTSDLSRRRQFSYLRYGAYLSLGQVCAAESSKLASLPEKCREHFEEAHRLCPRAEPLVYLALSLPEGSTGRVEALRRAERVAPLQASTGHCALYAEPAIYERLPALLRDATANSVAEGLTQNTVEY